MKALIIYQDFISGANANELLQHSSQYLETSVDWKISQWHMDLLKFPPTAEEALADAADAHLVVFAGRDACACPNWLEKWLDLWASQRLIKDVVLAVIDDKYQTKLSQLTTLELGQFAKRHDLRFLLEGRERIERISGFARPVTLTKPEPSRLLLRQGNTGPTCRQAYQNWGLNE